jgi:CRISPR-associated protein Csb2
VHAVLRFARPVAGPLVLGRGRYRGLGLFLPLEG